MRKRVIHFVQKWVIAVRQAVFEEPLTVAFIEVSLHKFKYTLPMGFRSLIEYNMTHLVVLCRTVNRLLSLAISVTALSQGFFRYSFFFIQRIFFLFRVFLECGVCAIYRNWQA